MSTTPDYGAYSNEQSDRVVSITYRDVGGFSNATVQGHIWIESLHDASQDGISDASEYQPHPIAFTNLEHDWTISMNVNDSTNNDHQTVRVWLQGTDMAGYAIEDSNAENGTLWWESRTPEKGDLVDFEGVNATGEITRLEPTKSFSWHVEVTDTNRSVSYTHLTLPTKA